MRIWIPVAGLALAAAAVAGAVVAIANSTPPYHPNGPQIRVTLAEGCPRTLVRAGDVRPGGPGLGSALTPTGTPNAGVVCSYRTGRHVTDELSRATQLDAGGAATLAAALGRVRIVSAPGEVSCPADFGRFAVIVLGYPGRPDVDIWYETTGCQRMDNGVVETYEVANPSFYLRFERVYERLVGAG